MSTQNLTLKAEQKFSEFLTLKDLKYTSQRKTILEESLNASGHFTADDLLDIAKERDKSISKATLYRTLSLLTEAQILEEHDFGNGRKSYEPLLGQSHHDHLICLECKKIFEFENDEIEQIQEREAAKIGFQILHHSHKLFGRCSACSGKAH